MDDSGSNKRFYAKLETFFNPPFSFSRLKVISQNQGGAGSCLWSCRFSESDDRPSKEICQSFENRKEHARNAKDSCYFVCETQSY